MFTNLQNNVPSHGGFSPPSSCLSSCNSFKFQMQQKRKLSSSSSGTNSTTMMSDAELAKEMMELSVKEREKVWEDIHGVASPQEETPSFISECLKEFDIALNKIPKSKTKALDRAYFLKPSLCCDFEFKLMFLRSDDYDSKKASYRMVRYFEHKRNLFGDDLLARTIRLKDLATQDMEFFERGALIELKQRDQTGRPIWFVDINRCDWNNPISLFRCSWYLMMSTVENDDIAQKRGVCQVVYHNYSNNSSDQQHHPSNLSYISKIFETILKSGDLFTSLPCRVTSSHQCYENPNSSALKILSAMRIAFGKELRLRMKVHFGTEIEIDYELLTFGILRRTTTSSSGNRNNRDGSNNGMESLFHEYKQRRTEIELQEELKDKENSSEGTTGSSSSQKIIVIPNPEDVLVGRGKPYHEYSGNIQFTKLIDSLLDKYEACGEDHFAKTCLSINVVKSVQEEYGGRFLLRQTTASTTTKRKKSNKGSGRSGGEDNDMSNNNYDKNVDGSVSMGWVLADNAIARQKAASAFRSKILAKYTPTNNNNSKNNTASSKEPRHQQILMMMQQQPQPISSSSSLYHNPQQKHQNQLNEEEHHVANKRPRFFL